MPRPHGAKIPVDPRIIPDDAPRNMGGSSATSERSIAVVPPAPDSGRIPPAPDSGRQRKRTASLLAALSELAAKVQRGRTVDEVLQTAGRGVTELGMRLGAFQAHGNMIELRYVATSPGRLAAIEARIGGPLVGLRARVETQPLIYGVVRGRRTVFREDLDVFDSFIREVSGYDPSPLEGRPETASVTNGVLAPIFVADQPWGLLALCSEDFTRDDAEAVVLFATHVGSAIEVAESLEALEKAQVKLVERERLAALGELAAVVAHEVRNPLGVLFNTIASLKKIVETHMAGEKQGEAQLLLGIAADESERLNHIAEGLLTFTRPNIVVTLAPTLVSHLLTHVASFAASARVVVDVAPNLGLVRVDARSFAQALLNLTLNALHATENGTVILRARAEAAFIHIEIVDDGPGIPAEFRSRIYEPFFTTKASGTGLGLAIVKRIVDAHDASISFETSSRGTTFTIRLPAAKLG